MTLYELLNLEEATPCPGCPVCKPRMPRHGRMVRTPRSGSRTTLLRRLAR